MSKFNYQEYKEKAEATTSTTTKKEWTERPKVSFMANFLKKDGDSVIVRFPYSTPNDFDVEHVHEVSFPGSQYPQKVECTMDDKNECVLCAVGTKKVDRFLVKCIAYVVNNTTNTVDLIPVVWDRPMKYADELASKMTDYGDLSEHLFKIKKNGSGQNTTYSTDIVLNKAVYKDDIYVKDFSSIEELNPSFLLVRRMSKYLELTQPKEETVSEDEMPSEEAVDEPVNETPVAEAQTTRVDPTERRPIKRFSNIK